MRIELIVTGEEILDGRVLNTNTQTVALFLQKQGFQLARSTTIGDDFEDIKTTIQQRSVHADVMLISGGLGPTDDDRTMAALAAACELPIYRDSESECAIRHYFQSKNRPFPEANLKQADFPQGGIPIPNLTGTAPGVILEYGGTVYMTFPGVPQELKAMIAEVALPYLSQRFSDSLVDTASVTLKTFGIGESTISDRLTHLYPLPEHVSIGYRAHYPEVHVTIGVVGEGSSSVLLDWENKVRNILSDYVFGVDDDEFVDVIAQLCQSKGIHLAVVESCTGGLLSKLITDTPGASQHFDAGVITYSNAAKAVLADVPGDVIEANGAVSEAVAGAMTNGAYRRLGVDATLSITGVAGPGGGSDDKPVGMVCIGICVRGDVTTHTIQLHGSRDRIRLGAAYHALWLLYHTLLSTK